MNEVKTSMDEIAEGSVVKLPSFAERLAAIFVEPRIVFDFIAHRTDFWYSFLGFFVITCIGSVLSLPASIKMQGILAEMTGKPAPQVDAMAYLKVIGSVAVMFLLIFIVRAVLLWLVTTVTSGGSSFVKTINVACWTAYPYALATLLNGIVVAVTRPEVTSLQAATKEANPVIYFTSAAALMPSASIYIGMALAVISLFAIWEYWLLAIGIKRSLGGNAVAVAVFLIVLFIFQVGWQLLQAYGFSKLPGAS
jgi:hypothetical protein